ncbi:hypothetical protein GCM10023166_00560 [Paeniglutamicibacter cryotolerans]
MPSSDRIAGFLAQMTAICTQAPGILRPGSHRGSIGSNHAGNKNAGNSGAWGTKLSEAAARHGIYGVLVRRAPCLPLKPHEAVDLPVDQGFAARRVHHGRYSSRFRTVDVVAE